MGEEGGGQQMLLRARGLRGKLKRDTERRTRKEEREREDDRTWLPGANSLVRSHPRTQSPLTTGAR